MKPWMFTVLFQLFTVSLMVILESFYGALLTVGFSSEIWTTWIHHIPINWCVALPLMILVCNPFDAPFIQMAVSGRENS